MFTKYICKSIIISIYGDVKHPREKIVKNSPIINIFRHKNAMSEKILRQVAEDDPGEITVMEVINFSMPGKGRRYTIIQKKIKNDFEMSKNVIEEIYRQLLHDHFPEINTDFDEVAITFYRFTPIQ